MYRKDAAEEEVFLDPNTFLKMEHLTRRNRFSKDGATQPMLFQKAGTTGKSDYYGCNNRRHID
jgi:hypothetical protein